MVNHTEKPASPQDALRRKDGNSSNSQKYPIQLKINTALQMEAEKTNKAISINREDLKYDR
jgi:hypothetical protein